MAEAEEAVAPAYPRGFAFEKEDVVTHNVQEAVVPAYPLGCAFEKEDVVTHNIQEVSPPEGTGRRSVGHCF